MQSVVHVVMVLKVLYCCFMLATIIIITSNGAFSCQVQMSTIRDFVKRPTINVTDHRMDEPAHRDEDRTEADELARKVRVLCWIMTQPSNHVDKARHVKATWGKRCNKLLFMSSEDAANKYMIRLMKDTVAQGRFFTLETIIYQRLSFQCLKVGITSGPRPRRLVYEHHRRDADWFLKADDDTYVVVENLRYMLSEYNSKDPVYFGCRFKPFNSQGYMSGGADYVLSGEALDRFINKGLRSPHLCEPSEHGAEDAEMDVVMTVPKVVNVTEDLETAKVESDRIYKRNNTQDKEAVEPSDKENKPRTIHEEYQKFKNDAGQSTGVAIELESFNDINTINEVTLQPYSKTGVRFSPLMRQVRAASLSVLLAFSSGLTIEFPILLPQLASDGATENTIHWIVLFGWLAVIPGCVISGWTMEQFGRRISLGITCVSLLCGWIFIASGTNASFRTPLLLVGRFLTGLSVGLSAPLSPVYISETIEPTYRGFFLAGLTLTKALGFLAMQTLGFYLTWQWVVCICCYFPIQAMAILFVIPESPTWLISKGRVEEGVKSFGWLRGDSDKANAELRGMLEEQNTLDSGLAMNWLMKLRALKSQEVLKPLFIMTVFFIVSALPSLIVFMFYFVRITTMVFPSTSYYFASLSLQVGIVIISALACVVCQCLGRRLVCIFSGIFTALSLIALCVLSLLTERGYIDMPLLTFVCMMVYICAVSIGLEPLPWVMCGEILPTRIRGLGSGIVSAIYFAVFCVFGFTTTWMTDQLGFFVFLLYGVCTLAGTIVLYFILPETKGRCLQQIEEEFKFK